MSTIHTRARDTYRKLAARNKQHPNDIDTEVMKLLVACMKRIPEHTEKGLHPLHREFLLCMQKTIRSETRDRTEVAAFQKIRDVANADELALLRRFYKLPRPKDFHPQLSKRRHDAKTLMNNYREQVDIASEYFEKNPSAGKAPRDLIPKEPEGWRARAMGAYQDPSHSSWKVFYQNYGAEARRILAGEDLS